MEAPWRREITGPVDPGTQIARTAMSWQRTTMGIVGTGVLAMRWGIVQNFPPFPGVLLAGVGAFSGLLLVRGRYRRVLRAVADGRAPVSHFLIPATTALVVAVILAFSVGIGLEFAYR